MRRGSVVAGLVAVAAARWVVGLALAVTLGVWMGWSAARWSPRPQGLPALVPPLPPLQDCSPVVVRAFGPESGCPGGYDVRRYTMAGWPPTPIPLSLRHALRDDAVQWVEPPEASSP